MLAQLASVALDARRAAGRTQLDIATTAGVSHTTISRFERAQSWPLDPDRIVEAYADECGVDAAELWRAAAARLAP